MKIQDLEQMPHLYLDMDGVQADLFHAMAKREKVDHWDDIADQDDAIKRLALSGPYEVYQLFRELDPLPGGQVIIKWLHQHHIPFTVLSAPLRNEPQASIEAKRDWLDQYNPGTSGHAIFTSGKQKYAITNGTKNVLVDDFGPYIQKWIDAGGIPVKHAEEFEDPNTAQHTISMLEKIYSPYLNK